MCGLWRAYEENQMLRIMPLTDLHVPRGRFGRQPALESNASEPFSPRYRLAYRKYLADNA